MYTYGGVTLGTLLTFVAAYIMDQEGGSRIVIYLV